VFANRKAVAATEGTDAENLLRELAALGEKKTGSPAGGRARQLIDSAMQRATGGKCRLKTETFPVTVCNDSACEIRFSGGALPGVLLDYTGTGPAEVSGRLVRAGYGSRAEFLLARGAGAVVACKANLMNHRVLQVKRARARGAVAVILVSGHDDLCCKGVGWPQCDGPCPIPAVSVTRRTWRKLRGSVGSQITVNGRQTIRETEGANLVYDIGSESATDRLVLGAHYDTWQCGAQDNCAGVALLVAVAGRLAKERMRSPLRCIFFDGEELGMIGSRWHVSRNDVANYRLYVNLEMPVPSRGGRLKTFFFSRKFPLRRLRLFRLLRKAYLPVPLEWFYWAGNSHFPADVDPFHKAGVPSATTFCNGRYYHTAADTPDRLRTERLGSLEATFVRMMLAVGSA